MISQLTGSVISRGSQTVVINLGFVALDIAVPDATKLCLGESISLHIHMHWNQEQGPTLFGFVSRADRELFNIVLDCSGVGPKLALNVVAELGADQFVHAIKSGNAAALCAVSGIGQKKAEQMLFHLKTKVDILLEHVDATHPDGSITPMIHDITQALKALNYSRTEIQHAITHIKSDIGHHPVVFDQLFRKALLFLTRP